MKKSLAIIILLMSSILVEQAHAGLLGSIFTSIGKLLFGTATRVAITTTVIGITADMMTAEAEASISDAVAQGKTEVQMLQCSDNRVYPISKGCPSGETIVRSVTFTVKAE